MTPSKHYSYSHYADPDTARTFDDRRFGGPIGDLVAATQADVILRFVGEPERCRILDVGTGTGRAALLLARAGARVTAVDASEAMLDVARQRAQTEGVRVDFQHGDAHALGFPDRAFDVVVCLRVLMHAPDWRRSLAELCRVSDRLVVVDYPSARGFALVESIARRVAHAAGVTTEPYRVFGDRRIDEAFRACGFQVRARHRQFVLPIALHKAIGSKRLTLGVERGLERVGALALVGSPVSVLAERCGSS